MFKHRNHVEWHLQNGFEGRTAHRTTQYLRGSLFVYIDYLLGNNFNGTMKGADDPAKHPFEIDEIQDLIKATLRLICTLFVKVTTMPKIVSQWPFEVICIVCIAMGKSTVQRPVPCRSSARHPSVLPRVLRTAWEDICDRRENLEVLHLERLSLAAALRNQKDCRTK